MCGIAGLSLCEKDRTTEIIDVMVSELLERIDHRGGDATGAAWVSEGERYVAKQPGDAKDFLECGYADDLVDDLPEACILHTRKATSGDVSDNVNNHPIETDGIIGIHNGMLHNHDKLFEKYKLPRYGQVDSELLFAMIYAKGLNSLDEVDGDAAIAWFDNPVEAEPGYLHVARLGHGRPMYASWTEHGSFVFASTSEAVDSAVKAADLQLRMNPFQVPAGHHARLLGGNVLDWDTDAPKIRAPSYVSKSTLAKADGKGASTPKAGGHSAPLHGKPSPTQRTSVTAPPSQVEKQGGHLTPTQQAMLSTSSKGSSPSSEGGRNSKPPSGKPTSDVQTPTTTTQRFTSSSVTPVSSTRSTTKVTPTEGTEAGRPVISNVLDKAPSEPAASYLETYFKSALFADIMEDFEDFVFDDDNWCAENLIGTPWWSMFCLSKLNGYANTLYDFRKHLSHELGYAGLEDKLRMPDQTKTVEAIDYWFAEFKEGSNGGNNG